MTIKLSPEFSLTNTGYGLAPYPEVITANLVPKISGPGEW